MRFLSYAVLVLSAAALASAGVRSNEDEEVSAQRYRLIKRSDAAEGRMLSQLLALKGGGCPPPETTSITITPPDVTETGESVTYTFPLASTVNPSSVAREFQDDDEEEADDDLNNDDDSYGLNLNMIDDDDNENSSVDSYGLSRRPRPNQVLTLQEYEMRRQAEENKQLRQRIQQLRRQNMQTRRMAQRARVQQLRRSKNQRRRANNRNRAARRRLNNRHRNMRRRQRRNRRRN